MTGADTLILGITICLCIALCAGAIEVWRIYIEDLAERLSRRPYNWEDDDESAQR